MAESFPDESHHRIKYLILGCGSIGYNVVEELYKETDEIQIIDRDEKRVEDLCDQKYEAIARDLTDPNLLEGVPLPEVAFVLSSDKEANLAAVKTIKKESPSIYVIARALDPVSVKKLEQAEADIVLYPQEVIAKSAVQQIRKLYSSRLAHRLYNLLSEMKGTLGIITHTNPDPDTISSAMALCSIGKHASDGALECRIFYDGDIGHQENRAFVNLLEIKMERLTPEAIAECDSLALVDSSVPSASTSSLITTKTATPVIMPISSMSGRAWGRPQASLPSISRNWTSRSTRQSQRRSSTASVPTPATSGETPRPKTSTTRHSSCPRRTRHSSTRSPPPRSRRRHWRSSAWQSRTAGSAADF
jgi:hypothetical protein